jgi:hypothetical protein
MTQPQFGAEAGRRAEFRETLRGTLDCMAGDKLVSEQEAAEWARCPDETLALRLLARSLETAVDLQEQLVVASATMEQADRVLKLMLRAQTGVAANRIRQEAEKELAELAKAA